MTNGNEVQPFAFPTTGQQVRTILIDGQPWFVAADVTTVLGYGGGARNAIVRLPERMKGVEDFNTPGGVQKMTIVSEPGVYRLVMRSNLPAAEAFQDWIAEEVVPAIRHTGSYSTAPALPQDYEEALVALLDEVRTNKVLIAENAKLKVKAEAFDDWINGKGCYLIGTVAKMIGIGPRALWDFLYAEKILINRPGSKRHREPYSRQDSAGWFEVKAVLPERANGHAARTSYLTPYGAEKVRLLLIKRGLLPHEQLAFIDGTS